MSCCATSPRLSEMGANLRHTCLVGTRTLSSSTVEEERVRGHGGSSSRKSLHRAFPWDPAGIYRPKGASMESASSEEWINGTMSSRRERTLPLTTAVVRWGPFLPSLRYTRLSFHRLVVPHPMSALFQRPHLLFAGTSETSDTGPHRDCPLSGRPFSAHSMSYIVVLD